MSVELPPATPGEHELYYYTLPIGYRLYRGDDMFSSDAMLPRQLTFFGTSPGSVEQYGTVFEFETTNEYKLLALDHTITTKKLLEEADADSEIKQIMIQNFGFLSGKRDSNVKKDKLVSNYLCSKGYQGYATNMMENEDKYRGDFHVEVAICDPSGLQLVKQISPAKGMFRAPPTNMKTLRKERKTLITNTPGKNLFDDELLRLSPTASGHSKLPGKSLFGDETPENKNFGLQGKSLFGDDDSEDENDNKGPLNRRLFGGKKTKKSQKSRKTRKSRKSRKSKKSKKTKKSRKTKSKK